MQTMSAVNVSVTAILGSVLLFTWAREREGPFVGWWGCRSLCRQACGPQPRRVVGGRRHQSAGGGRGCGEERKTQAFRRSRRRSRGEAKGLKSAGKIAAMDAPPSMTGSHLARRDPSSAVRRGRGGPLPPRIAGASLGAHARRATLVRERGLTVTVRCWLCRLAYLKAQAGIGSRNGRHS